MEALILGLGRINEDMKVHGLAGLFMDTKKTKSRRGKDAAGASGNLGQDGAVQTAVLSAGTIPTTVLPAQVGLGNNETGLPVDPTLPTEVRETTVGDQQEQVQEDDAGSSNAGNGSG
ncbi:hypothetical protein Bca101_059086 [Brassica carinata]